MIVFSSGIVITPAVASERWKPVLLAQSLVTASNISADNEDAAYPPGPGHRHSSTRSA